MSMCRSFVTSSPHSQYERAAAMFGEKAPVWRFLNRFGGPTDPRAPVGAIHVFETYPALTLIALGWVLKDSRPAGRLP
jgi:hypothetical protein